MQKADNAMQSFKMMNSLSRGMLSDRLVRVIVMSYLPCGLLWKMKMMQSYFQKISVGKMDNKRRTLETGFEPGTFR